MSAVLFQTMPPLSPDEYRQLEASCLEHGIQVPIIVDEAGAVIDGHHRQKIAQEHGIYLPTETRDTLTNAGKTALSISLNIDRRQLSRDQRRSIIESSLKAEPEMSDREHAKRAGVDHKTVGAVRGSLESTGEIPQSDVRVSADGRERPATQPERFADASSIDAHPVTGEVFDAPTTITETHTLKTVTGPEPKPKPEPNPSSELSLVNDIRLYLNALGSSSEIARLSPAAKQHIITALKNTVAQIERHES